MNFTKGQLTIVIASVAAILGGCANEASRTLAVPELASAQKPFAGKAVPVSIGKFDNQSSYMRGVFSDGVDRLGGQAKTILVTSLQRSRRFAVLDRDNLAETKLKAGFANKAQSIRGANYVITGNVTEFGRKEVGDRELFGLLGHET